MGWKMVRDRNQEWCEANGVSGTWRAASQDEAFAALGRKLGEEVLEYLENGDPAELFDLRDVLAELISLVVRRDPVAYRAAHDAHAAKVAEQGTFSGHVMWCPVPEDHLQAEPGAAADRQRDQAN